MEKELQNHFNQFRRNIVGIDATFESPFGKQDLIYADWIASGRLYKPIEEKILNTVGPFVANTHTETSATGLQTTRFREEAREIIARSVGAGDEDVVIFCGSGTTGAIHKLIDVLNLRLPADLDARYQLSERIPREERPVVFIGPYEHHSNEISWRQSLAKSVEVRLDKAGNIDLVHLEEA